MRLFQSPHEIRILQVASFAGLAILILLALSACQTGPQSYGSMAGSPTETAASMNPTTMVVTHSPAVSETQGKLVPRHSRSMSLAEGARVNRVFVSEGQTVSAGDLLVRLDGYEQLQAQLVAAQADELIARQSLDELYKNAETARAEAEVVLAELEKEQALAENHYNSLAKPLPQMTIDAAKSNLLLAEKQVKKAQDDLAKAERIFNNKKHIIWRFINKRQFKLRITLLKQKVAEYERHYQDSAEKYQDLVTFPDPIDLELAEARLEQANSHLAEAQRTLKELSRGPDPDDIEIAQSRLNSTLARLEAARVALYSTQLVAPISGEIVDLQAEQGKWISPGVPAVVIADLSEWRIESDEVTESIAQGVSPDQTLQLQVPALPDLALDGKVESLSQDYREEDGDIYYTIKIIPLQNDPRLRWGMTVNIELPLGSSAN